MKLVAQGLLRPHISSDERQRSRIAIQRPAVVGAALFEASWRGTELNAEAQEAFRAYWGGIAAGIQVCSEAEVCSHSTRQVLPDPVEDRRHDGTFDVGLRAGLGLDVCRGLCAVDFRP